MTRALAIVRRHVHWNAIARSLADIRVAPVVCSLNWQFKAYSAVAASPPSQPGLHAQVTFPSRLDDGHSSPVVVILGWLHGADKHLAKYSAFYNENGCIAVRIPVTSMPAVFSRTVERGQQVLDVLAKEPFVRRDVVFHVFSNGGCSVLTQILRLLSVDRPRGECDFNARGLIYDSAPSRPRLASGVRANTAHIANPLDRLLRQVVVGLRIVVNSLPRSWAAFSGRNPSLYNELRLSTSRLPELFLNSKVDQITRHQDVTDFVAYRRQLGVDTAQLCWEDSGHVSHLLAHREEYIRKCLSFVEHCCNSSQAK